MGKRWLIVLVIALVIAAVGGYFWNEHREAQKLEAEIYCTMDTDIPGIYSPEFKNCVDQYLD